MPIDTAVPGDPVAVRAVATWLRSTFALAVSGYTDTLTAARTTAGADWDGDASWGFQSVMTTLARHGDDLDTDAQTAATGLDDFATALETAQKDMAAVRTAATLAGLVVVADQIHEPGPAPVAPRGPLVVGATTSRAATPFDRHVVTLAEHDAKVTAYAQAETDTATIFVIYQDAIEAMRTIPDATGVRWGLVTGTFVGSFVGGLHGVGVRALKSQVLSLKSDVDFYETRYLESRTPGERTIYDGLKANASQTLDETDLLIKESANTRFARLWSGRLPIVGTAVTFVGIGWDVHNGKDVSTALVGATAGTVAGVLLAGATVSAGAPVVVVAIGVTLVVFGASWLAERFWEDGVSAEVKAKVDEGGRWVADQVKSAGSAIADGASYVWGLVT